MEGLFDLLKYYAFEGGIAGIVIGAFLLFGIYLLNKNSRKGNATVNLFMILFFLLGALAIGFGSYGAINSRSIRASRIADKNWSVQLQSDNTPKDALEHKEIFQTDFRDLVVILRTDVEAKTSRFYLFNLYFSKQEADNGTALARREWRKFDYEEKYKDSAETVNLKDLCKSFLLSEDGKYFICSNE